MSVKKGKKRGESGRVVECEEEKRKKKKKQVGEEMANRFHRLRDTRRLRVGIIDDR